MNREEKAAVIEGLKAKADAAQIAVVTDFKGLKVEDMTELRVKLREQDVEYAVVKNTLARIAFTDGQHEVIADKLKECCAVALGNDPVAAAKALVDFAKSNKKFSVRFGSLEGKFLEEKELENLSKLPSKEELLAKALGTMNAVPTNFVSLLANVPRGLLNVLTAIKDQKEAA
ncbi:MAG: 50S ribosomal protein L10 [Desulfovibrio sp.]|nr:MAG: 50S ribosomal protein L10 [Desulfovibrio sp.]